MTDYRNRLEAGEFEPPADAAASGLDGMTKEQLLERATQLGVTPANAGMTKDELKAGIEQAERR